jgi:hypothetical protein
VHDVAFGKPTCIEQVPFDPEVMVLEVDGKTYKTVVWEEMLLRVSLKCDAGRGGGGRRSVFFLADPPSNRMRR